MARIDGTSISLDYESKEDAALLAKAIRSSVFHDLTVKDFMASEAHDVLLYLWSIVVNAEPEKEKDEQ